MGVRSGGGGLSHSGRMTAEYTLAQGFRQMQVQSVEGFGLSFQLKCKIWVEISEYRGIIFFKVKFTESCIKRKVKAMTKIDIYSGFLGAGKTTLIKKMISEGYQGEKLVLIENEFGEIGIDGGFLQEAGININLCHILHLSFYTTFSKIYPKEYYTTIF